MRPISARLSRAVAAALVTVATAATLVGGFGASIGSADVATFSGCQQCYAAAADSQGNVFATDSNSHQVLKFDSNGNLIAAWGSYGNGPGLFQGPGDIAIDNSNNVYVADSSNGIEEFNDSGTYLRTFDGLYGESYGGVAVDPAGDVFEAYGGTSINEYSSAGAQLNSWALGTNGVPSGYLSGLAYSSANGDIYAVDEPADLVLQFTSSGAYVGSWGSYGSGAGQFEYPTGVAVDSSGNVYVSDEGRVQQFSEAGGYEGSYSIAYTSFDDITYSNNSIYATTYHGIMRINMTLPIASVSASSTTPQTSQTVTFNASSSSLPFGSITDYRWDLTGSGNFSLDTGATPTASTVFTQPGTTVVGVQVTGSSGLTAVAHVTVTTKASTASISATGSALTGQSVTFDASRSSLSNSTITDYSWDLNDSGQFTTDTGTTSTVSESFNSPGTYKVGVQVTRSAGVVNTAYATVNVTPAPPSGIVGVSIDDGAYATDSPSVTLALVWPAGATSALVSNDGGFNGAGNTKTVSLAAEVPWKLQTTGIGRLTRIVYVRYLGSSNGLLTFTDDIILDEQTPDIASATLMPTADSSTSGTSDAAFVAQRKAVALKHHYVVRVVGSESISGISAIQLSTHRGGGAVISLKSKKARGILKMNRLIADTGTVAPSYARLRSAAGKWSRWLAVTALA